MRYRLFLHCEWFLQNLFDKLQSIQFSIICTLLTFLYDVGMICDAKSDCLQSESCEDGRCTVPEGTMGSNIFCKVEKILKGSLDQILLPSPSIEIQIMSGKVWLRCGGKTLLGIVNKLLKTKSLQISPSNFPSNNLNFH